jgi:hypothetical protein
VSASGCASGDVVVDVSVAVAVSLAVVPSVDGAASPPASFECELEPPPHPTTKTTMRSEATPTSWATAERRFRSRTK